jgi:ubiquitin-large subunit ribosomal protein L40e
MDRTDLSKYCIKSYGWKEGDAHRLVNEFCDRFIPIKRHLKDYDDELCSPPLLIEKVWQAALLFTKGYAALCDGPFIHRDPNCNNQSDLARQRYERATSVYVKMFSKNPPNALWPKFEDNVGESDKDLSKESKRSVKLVAATNEGSKRSSTTDRNKQGLLLGNDSDSDKEACQLVSKNSKLSAIAADQGNESSSSTVLTYQGSPISSHPFRLRSHREGSNSKAKRSAEDQGPQDVKRTRQVIYVKGLRGELIPIDTTPGITVDLFKQKINAITGISVCQQRLIFAGKQLEGEKTLAEYGICYEWTIHLVLSLKGC